MKATEESRRAWIDAATKFEGRVAAHIAVADIYDPIEAIKAVVLLSYIGETIALRDRNHPNSPWRKIYLKKTEKDQWRDCTTIIT